MKLNIRKLIREEVQQQLLQKQLEEGLADIDGYKSAISNVITTGHFNVGDPKDIDIENPEFQPVIEAGFKAKVNVQELAKLLLGM